MNTCYSSIVYGWKTLIVQLCFDFSGYGVNQGLAALWSNFLSQRDLGECLVLVALAELNLSASLSTRAASLLVYELEGRNPSAVFSAQFWHSLQHHDFLGEQLPHAVKK